MRSSAVRQAIVTALTAISTDDKASGRDKFVHLQSGQRDVESAVDRTFTLTLTAQPHRAETDAISTFEVEYMLTVFYVSVPGPASGEGGAEDRMANDSERIYAAMDRLHSQNADINVCTVSPIGITDALGALKSQWSLVVGYRLTSGVEA
jgi:hypothetical protein